MEAYFRGLVVPQKLARLLVMQNSGAGERTILWQEKGKDGPPSSREMVRFQ